MVDADRFYYELWLGRINDKPQAPQATGVAGVLITGAHDTLSLCEANTEQRLGFQSR